MGIHCWGWRTDESLEKRELPTRNPSSTNQKTKSERQRTVLLAGESSSADVPFICGSHLDKRLELAKTQRLKKSNTITESAFDTIWTNYSNRKLAFSETKKLARQSQRVYFPILLFCALFMTVYRTTNTQSRQRKNIFSFTAEWLVLDRMLPRNAQLYTSIARHTQPMLLE